MVRFTSKLQAVIIIGKTNQAWQEIALFCADPLGLLKAYESILVNG